MRVGEKGATLGLHVTKVSHAASLGEIPIGVSFCTAFSPAGDGLATCGKRTVILWDIETRKKRWETTTLKDPSELAFSPDGSRIAAKNTAGRVVLLDARDGSVVRTVDKGRGEGAAPVFSTKGDKLVHGSWEGELFVHDLESGAETRRSFEGQMIRAIHRAGDGWLLVCSSIAGGSTAKPDKVSLYSARLEGEPLGGFELPDLNHTALSPDGKLLAASRSHHGEVVIVEVATGKMIAQTKAKFGGTGAAIQWGPELIGSVQDGRVEIYSGSLQRLGGIELGYPSDVAFSPDGAYVAFGSWSDGVVRKLGDVLGGPG